MPNIYAKTLSEWWGRQNFRTQLTISHGGLVVVALVVLAAVVNLFAEQILVGRGFDLLLVTNRLSTARLNERLDALENKGGVCDENSQRVWREISSSPHLLGFVAATGEPGLQIQRENGEARILVNSPCGGRAGTRQAALLKSTWLSSLFNDRTGLGESGETYLITDEGQLVTESRFLDNPAPAPVPADLPAHWHGIKNDYRGIPVLAAWSRVEHRGFRGFVASEIDEAEVRGPVRRLFIAVAAFSLLMLGLTAALVPWLAHALSRNVERARELEQVKNLALIEGQERERVRLSLELHDDIGQRLTALGWRVAGGTDTTEERDALVRTVRDVASRVRHLSGDLSNVLVQEVGLPKALRQLVEDARQIRGGAPSFDLRINGEEVPLPDQRKSTAVYRVAQETLANIFKHSRATHASYELNLGDERVQLVVEDDGVGFEPGHSGPGLGLKNMRVRAEAFGGRFSVGRRLPQGTRVEMEIPLGGKEA